MKLWQKKYWMKRRKNCASLHGLCEYIGNPNVVTWDYHIYIHSILVLVGGGGQLEVIFFLFPKFVCFRFLASFISHRSWNLRVLSMVECNCLLLIMFKASYFHAWSSRHSQKEFFLLLASHEASKQKKCFQPPISTAENRRPKAIDMHFYM